MITKVNWQWIILDNTTSGWRVARRTGGPPPTYAFGTDMPMGGNWIQLATSPLVYPKGGDPTKDTYLFAFWSLVGFDSVSGQSLALIQGNPANWSQNGGQWTITATAYYYSNFGSGGGDNALLIDAFDLSIGAFIPDNFVQVTPDPTGNLTVDANNGYIDTTTQIANGSPPPALTVTAQSVLPSNKQFQYWLYFPYIPPWFFSNNPAYPATVGTPTPQDIVVHYNDVVLAIGMYTDLPYVVTPPSSIYNPWWWVLTGFGTIPPQPQPDPWLIQYAAAVSLANAARGLSPQLQARVLEIVLEQMAVASAALKQQIGALQGE